MFDVNNLVSIQIGLASPEKIREWSNGEVTKPETINYRSQKPEPDGLFCEKIFGPAKDYECHCGKYKKSRYKGIVCDRCHVEITTKAVRRERMGCIELASPCAHIWYLKGIPSKMGLILGISPKLLEDIVYFKSHICLDPGEKSKILEKKQVFDERTGRVVFQEVIEKEILPTLDSSSMDYQDGVKLVQRLMNSAEPFNFFETADYVKDFTGAKFGVGAEAIQYLLSEVDLDAEFDKIQKELKDEQGPKRAKLIKRLETIEAFKTSNNRPEWMVLDVLPVIPPDLRPMLPLDGGRFATSDLNDLYRRVINRNNRLKKLIDINSPDVILMNEKRMLQEAVDSLIDNGRKGKPVLSQSGKPYKSLSTSLKGKSGRFRQNLLGKRVDFSGRSVIAVGPSLKMYQCGLPMEMAVQLFRPFIASIMIKEEIATSHKQANKMIDHYDAKVLDVAERVVKQHPVLLNRAPTLHRLGIQAFKPIIVAGHAIRLHPLVCTAFNADFDGDQMAVHVPLSKEAQEEALTLMLASNNILGPKDGKPIVTPSQDMILGNYYLTLESDVPFFKEKAEKLREIGDVDEAEKYDLYAQCEGKVFASIDEAILAYQTKQVHLHNRIALKGSALNKAGFTEEMNNSYLITTVGKIIFNQIFPSDFPYLNIQPTDKLNNLTGDKIEFFAPKGTNLREYIASMPLKKPFVKKDITAIIDEVFHKYHNPRTSEVLDNLKDQGFKYSTVSGITVSIADVALVQGKEEILKEGDKKVESVAELYEEGIVTDEERHNKVIKIWENVKEQIEVKLKKQLNENPRNPIFMMSDSGARGNMSNFLQLSGLRGLMANPSGGTIELPIKSCFREGLTVSEFFIATHGARKGGTDTALKTADSGYLTRRLVDVSHDVIIREIDCGTDHGFIVEEIRTPDSKNAIVPLFDRLVGRFSCHDIVHPETGELLCEKNTLMDEVIAQNIVDAGITRVEIRSLFGCETKDGVCVHCYGRNMASGNIAQVGDTVGIMAAQSIGEPGTQLTMRTFHTGGVAGSDITQGLPRVQELFEARKPKGEAIISEIEGTVKSVTVDEKNKYTIVIENDLESKEYVTVIGARVIVKEGDSVKNGDPLTAGAINPKTLISVADVTAVEKYIVQEVHKVYRLQGIDISDKHIEVIVKQMLRKMVIVDAGDTGLLPGTRIEVNRFTEANEKALLEGKRPAVGYPKVLGITKAALDTESFLSSASFQETTKVLTDAAIKGSIDYLHGLKENVMIGKLIPAGATFNLGDEEEVEIEEYDFEEEDTSTLDFEELHDDEDVNTLTFTELEEDEEASDEDLNFTNLFEE